jgi:surface antigen
MRTNKLPLFLVLTGILSIFSGCSSHLPKPVNDSVDYELPPASLPTYTPGEYFIFDNNFHMTVADIQEGLVTWKYSNDAMGVGYNDFLIPLGRTERIGERTETVSSVNLTDLWPLQNNKETNFETTQTIFATDASLTREVTRTWNCQVEGTAKVNVPAGNFDTFVINCKRFSGTDHGWRGNDRYYYSPDLNHYVMLERTSARRSAKTQKLTGYGFNSTYLPEKDQIQLRKLLQTVLNRHADGVAGTWTSSSKKISAMLIPTKSFSDSTQRKCREYRSVYSVEGRIREHVRELCHTQGGSWQRTQ